MNDESATRNKSKGLNASTDREALNASATIRKKTGDRSMDKSKDDIKLIMSKKSSNNVKMEEIKEEDEKSKVEEKLSQSLYHDKEIFEENFIEEESWKKFYENSYNLIPSAYNPDEKFKEEWRNKYIEMAVEEGMFQSSAQFERFINKKFNDFKKPTYTVNSEKNVEVLKNYEICLFPKFIMLLNS